MRQRYFSLITLILSLTIVLQNITFTQAQNPDELTIFAASSLTDVFIDLEDAFEAQTSINLTINFAGSSTLAAQIIQGAPVDIFASANLAQIDLVIDEGLIAATHVQIFAENELVVIVPQDNPSDIESAADLANEGVLLVLAAPVVPIREYTDALLLNLAAFYGEDYPEQVSQNIVSEEGNVRQVTARVALGEADAGIVYRTDVTPDILEDVQIIELPPAISPRAHYLIAPLLTAQAPDAATEFIAFLFSEAGQSILQTWGFCLPETIMPEETLMPEITPELTPQVESTPTTDVPHTSC